MKSHALEVSMEYNKAFLDCLTALRRQLRQEQGLSIRFNEPDAVPRMLAASARSEQAETRELGQRLAALSGVKLPAEPQQPRVLVQESSFVSSDFLAANQRYAGPLRG